MSPVWGLKRGSSQSRASPRAAASIRTAAQPSAACLCLLISSNFSKRQLSPAEELRSRKQLRWSPVGSSRPRRECRVDASGRPRGKRPESERFTLTNTEDSIDYFPPVGASGYHCACLQDVADVRVGTRRARARRRTENTSVPCNYPAHLTQLS